jgi:hypothetical protein
LNNGKMIEALEVQGFLDKLLHEIRERKLESVYLVDLGKPNQEANNSSI